MFKFIKARKDAMKCYKVLSSCLTIGHLESVCNMIDNYGKVYNYNKYWSKLYKESTIQLFEEYSYNEYKKRKDSIKNSDEVCYTVGGTP